MDDMASGRDRPPDSFPGHPAHYPVTPRKWHKKENRRLRIALGIESVLLFFGGILLFYTVMALLGTTALAPGGRLTQKIVREGDPSVRVAVIPVSGLIFTGDGPMKGTADWVIAALKVAGRDHAVKTVILEVNSPGGSITASDLIHHEIEKLREGGKKVVALFRGLAASGGYYVAAPADRIVAFPTALTGSIGVILETVNVEGLLEKIGVESVVVKSGEHKDMGSPFRKLSEDERVILQSISDEAYARFVSVVARGRGMTDQKVRELADGRILTATQAIEAGLVDEIGYFEDAVRAAETVAGITNATVVRYGRMPSLLDILMADSNARDRAVRLARLFSRMGPLYLADNLPDGGYVWRGGFRRDR